MKSEESKKETSTTERKHLSSHSNLEDAISPELAEYLVGEILNLEVQDITQIRRATSRLSPKDFEKFGHRLYKISEAVRHIKYSRKPYGKTEGAKKYKKARIQQLKDEGKLE